MTDHSDDTTRHATCVALNGRGVLITGASGSGKSSLGLRLIALGCDLVADDAVVLQRVDDRIIASPTPATSGLIEARGVGILRADHVADAELVLVVDLDVATGQRLPKRAVIDVIGCALPLIQQAESPHFVPAILQILRKGLIDPDA